MFFDHSFWWSHKFDFKQIATIVVNSIKVNSSILVKILIPEIKSRYGYYVVYKNAWMEKTKGACHGIWRLGRIL